MGGDAKLASEALTGIFASKPADCVATAETRLAEANQEKASWEAELSSLSVTPAGQDEMEPREALRELEKAMPADAMVSTDIGNICSVSNSYLRFTKPGSFFAAMAFGNCGYAFPAAMGAKMGAPDLPAIAVVFNNGQWGAEKKNQVDFYNNRFQGTNLYNPSFAELSKTMGAEGIRVTKPSEVGPALKTLIASGRPGVLEVMVSKTLADPFRR